MYRLKILIYLKRNDDSICMNNIYLYFTIYNHYEIFLFGEYKWFPGFTF